MSRPIMIVCLLMPGAVTLLPAAGQQTGPRYSEWSTPTRVPGLNAPSADYPNGISRDGLTLYFQRTSPGTGDDLYVVHRRDLEASWGTPVKLPDTVNSSSNDRGAFVSADGHWLFLSSDRPGGIGGNDLYVSWRVHVHDDGAWGPAMNLSSVNSVGFDSGPTFLENDESGTAQLYFNSAPSVGGTQAVADIYVSSLGPGGFGPPAIVPELNSPVQEGRPYIRHDGLEIFFQSNRSGPLAIWRSTRSSTTQPWTPPVLAISPAGLNDPGVTAVTTPVLSGDGTMLFIGVVRPGIDMGDIYVSTREKLRGKP